MSFDARDLLSLERPAARTLMPIFYYLLVALAVIMGLTMMYLAIRFNSLQGFFSGLFTIVLGVVGARVGCEVLLAILDIRDRR